MPPAPALSTIVDGNLVLQVIGTFDRLPTKLQIGE
jgi:hypothetical protein